DLNQTVEIRSASGVENAFRVVKANLADGTLVQEPPSPGAFLRVPPFDEIALDGPWPDSFEYTFRCNHCGQRLQLEAEIYHRGGGNWRPLSLKGPADSDGTTPDAGPPFFVRLAVFASASRLSLGAVATSGGTAMWAVVTLELLSLACVVHLLRRPNISMPRR